MTPKKEITNTDQLHEAIGELERKVKLQEVEMKANYGEVKENLHPKRVVKNTFSYLAETPEIQKTLVNTVIGFILGYASKKAAELLTEESLDRTVQNLVSHQMTILETRNPDNILAKGISLFRKHTPPSSPIYPFVRYK